MALSDACLFTAPNDTSAALDSNYLSDAAASYRSQGYAVLRNFASIAEIATLQKRANQIVEEFLSSDKGRDGEASHKEAKLDTEELCAVCRNGTVRNTTSAVYLAGSARAVRCFYQDELADDKVDTSKANADKPHVAKVGHALHDYDPIFRMFTRENPRVAQVVSEVLQLRNPTPVQSMLMFKQPCIDNIVSPHQDATYLHTEPHDTCIGFWIALQDADSRDKGCLEVVPGSHRDGLRELMILDPETGGPETKFVVLNGNVQCPEDSTYVPLPVQAGDAVVFHGALWHRSGRNVGAATRLAYTFHTVDIVKDESEWSKGNWLQPGPEAPFEALRWRTHEHVHELPVGHES